MDGGEEMEWEDQVGRGGRRWPKEGTQGETANMRLFVRDSVETQYSRSFLKYIYKYESDPTAVVK